MNEVGGYFELELSHGQEYHLNAIRLNTGRNAFEYILKTRKYTKVFLPYYTCEVMFEPIKKLELVVEFYHIDEDFYPIFDFNKITEKSVFVYTNYFGLFDKNIHQLSKITKNLIIDNSQAFYSQPVKHIDTFNSVRKFFGVSDGAYLFTDSLIDEKLERDLSYNRYEHLLGRIDGKAEDFYSSFKKNDHSLSNQPIKEMSNLTRRILQSIDYNFIAKKRRVNYSFLNEKFESTNQIKLILDNASVPLIYPYLTNAGNYMKQTLIKNKVFVATYWPDVLDRVKLNDFEYYLTNNLVCLPIDQRYNFDTLNFKLNVIIK